MFPRRPTERHVLTFSTAERPVCVPYKRKDTKPDRLKRQKGGSKSRPGEHPFHTFSVYLISTSISEKCICISVRLKPAFFTAAAISFVSAFDFST